MHQEIQANGMEVVFPESCTVAQPISPLLHTSAVGQSFPFWRFLYYVC